MANNFRGYFFAAHCSTTMRWYNGKISVLQCEMLFIVLFLAKTCNGCFKINFKKLGKKLKTHRELIQKDWKNFSTRTVCPSIWPHHLASSHFRYYQVNSVPLVWGGWHRCRRSSRECRYCTPVCTWSPTDAYWCHHGHVLPLQWPSSLDQCQTATTGLLATAASTTFVYCNDF